jgi:S-adenosylmethionine decarboxylase
MEESKEFSTFGRHVAVDLWGVDSEKINDFIFLHHIGDEAVRRSGARVESLQYKEFEPQGVTLLFLLTESHLSFHSYPERGFIAVDMYTCGETVYPQKGIDYIVEQLKPKNVYNKTLIRGIGEITVD